MTASGSALSIRPGEVNLMTAGRGIVHSERTAPEMRSSGQDMFGIQSWMALPKAREEVAPTFAHHAVGALPSFEGEGKRVRLIVGVLYGETSPATFPHDCFYAEAVLAPGAVVPLDPDYDERGVYLASGRVDIAGRHSMPANCLFSGLATHFSSSGNQRAADAARRRTDGRAA